MSAPTVIFFATRGPTTEQIEAVASATPGTPFNTPQYAAARSAVGEIPCVMGLKADGVVASGCVAFLKKGVLSRSLEITTAPSVAAPGLFWKNAVDFCRQERAADVAVGTFASEPCAVPPLPGEVERRPRREFVLDLRSADCLNNLSKGHRYDVKRAIKAGLISRRTRDPKAIADHLAVMEESMIRRKNRGEEVSSPRYSPLWEALLMHGAAELFQSTDGGKVVGSMLIVSSRCSAYYQTGGTSLEGMAKGAASFLTIEVARALREDGLRTFNLGGADLDNPGLCRFKAGFGASEVLLEAVSVSTISPAARKLRMAMSRLSSVALRYARSSY